MAPKKAKKSKAELEAEKLAREEEERKETAAREKREAEEAEKQRLENLRIQAERKAFRVAELERLSIEYADFLDRLKTKDLEREAQEKAESINKEWFQYRNPSDEPDARSERDMNTFISLLKESSPTDLLESLEQVQQIETIAAAMEDVWSDAQARGDTTAVLKAYDYLTQFYSMSIAALDAGTVATFKIADSYVNDRQEIHLEEATKTIILGLWASYNDMRPIRKALEFEKLGVKIDIPKQILSQDAHFAHRVIRLPIDVYSRRLNSDLKYASQYIVGDIYLFDILFTPPAVTSLRAKKWILRDNSTAAQSVRKSPYPSSVACKCFIKVPDRVAMSEDVRVAIWNDEHKDWSEEGITDYQYTESSRTAQFYMTSVGVVALVKSRVADVPYKKWSLAPIAISPKELAGGDVGARLTLVNKKGLEIVIDVAETTCRLIKPNNSIFTDLINVGLSPGQLVSKLQSRGVNIHPVYADATKIEDNATKVADLEEEVLLAISRSVSTLEFQSSPWNKSLSEYQIGLVVRESTIFTGGVEHFDFECVLAECDTVSESHLHAPEVGSCPGKAGVKYLLVLGNEYNDKKLYSLTPRPGEMTHVDFMEALASRLTSDAKERIRRGNERFHLTVFTLLKLVKPFSFAK